MILNFWARIYSHFPFFPTMKNSSVYLLLKSSHFAFLSSFLNCQYSYNLISVLLLKIPYKSGFGKYFDQIKYNSFYFFACRLSESGRWTKLCSFFLLPLLSLSCSFIWRLKIRFVLCPSHSNVVTYTFLFQIFHLTRKFTTVCIQFPLECVWLYLPGNWI